MTAPDPLLLQLREEWLDQHLTQEVIAARLNVHGSQISNWLTGRRGITLYSLRRLAGALGYDITLTKRGTP